jgi:hypothetical protein
VRFTQSSELLAQEEILAVKGYTVTKLRVTIKRARTASSQDANVTKKTEPIEGNMYVLEVKGGKILVTGSDGKAVPKKAAKLLRREYTSLGKPERVAQALPTTPLTSGKKLPRLIRAVKQSVIDSFPKTTGERWSIKDVSLRLTSKKVVKRIEHAVFSFSAHLSMKKPPRFDADFYLRGSMSFRLRDGWYTGMTLTGPVDVMGVDRAGAMRLVQTVTYP